MFGAYWGSKIAPGLPRIVRRCSVDRPAVGARTVCLLADFPIDLVVNFFRLSSYYWDSLYSIFSGFGGLKKKLAGQFLSRRLRADDSDYNPATDSEAQSSAGGSVSLDTEGAPHSHPDYPIDITGWTYPKMRFSMAEYSSRRTVDQFSLPSDTNIQYFHTQLQFDVFWGTLMDIKFHKHQVLTKTTCRAKLLWKDYLLNSRLVVYMSPWVKELSSMN